MVYDAPMPRLVACLVLGLVGCATTSRTELPRPPEPKDGPLQAAGARCQGGVCKCRPVDDFGRGTEGNTAVEGDVAPGKKRFEFRTGRGFENVRVTIDNQGTLVKDTTQVEPTCGYVDLPPGRHAIKLRVVATDKSQGIHPRLLIGEYGTKVADWYDIFAFACGATGPCIKDDMKLWLDQASAVPRGLFDKCSSTRVEGLRWSVEHSPEQTLEDLTLELVLHVYKFEPRFKHGTPSCKGLSVTGKAAEDELAQ